MKDENVANSLIEHDTDATVDTNEATPKLAPELTPDTIPDPIAASEAETTEPEENAAPETAPKASPKAKTKSKAKATAKTKSATQKAQSTSQGISQALTDASAKSVKAKDGADDQIGNGEGNDENNDVDNTKNKQASNPSNNPSKNNANKQTNVARAGASAQSAKSRKGPRKRYPPKSNPYYTPDFKQQSSSTAMAVTTRSFTIYDPILSDNVSYGNTIVRNVAMIIAFIKHAKLDRSIRDKVNDYADAMVRLNLQIAETTRDEYTEIVNSAQGYNFKITGKPAKYEVSLRHSLHSSVIQLFETLDDVILLQSQVSLIHGFSEKQKIYTLNGWRGIPGRISQSILNIVTRIDKLTNSNIRSRQLQPLQANVQDEILALLSQLTLTSDNAYAQSPVSVYRAQQQQHAQQHDSVPALEFDSIIEQAQSAPLPRNAQKALSPASASLRVAPEPPAPEVPSVSTAPIPLEQRESDASPFDQNTSSMFTWDEK